MPVILSQEEVKSGLLIQDVLSFLEKAYIEFSKGLAVNRPITHTYLPHSLKETTYSFKSVDGGIKEFGILAHRITSDVVRETEFRGMHRLEKLPLAGESSYVGLVLLFSVETGELLAIMPDGIIQQTRVAATSALGAKHLCRQDASILGLLGSGGQARSHLRYMKAVRPIQKVKIYSPNSIHRETFAKEMEKECHIPIVPVKDAKSAVEGSDLICSATNSSHPIVMADWLEPGMHYSAIREFEIEDRIFNKCDVVAIHTRHGGIQHFLPQGLEKDLPGIRREKPRDWSRYYELSELLAGNANGRKNDVQISFFLNNIGLGIQFAALGMCIYQVAKEKGLGLHIPNKWFLEDVKP